MTTTEINNDKETKPQFVINDEFRDTLLYKTMVTEAKKAFPQMPISMIEYAMLYASAGTPEDEDEDEEEELNRDYDKKIIEE
jgi:hypothetical protein